MCDGGLINRHGQAINCAIIPIVYFFRHYRFVLSASIAVNCFRLSVKIYIYIYMYISDCISPMIV